MTDNGAKGKRISDIYHKAMGEGRSVFSFEFFPPKNVAGKERLENTLKEVCTLKPDFISITCGAGGTGDNKTLEWSKKIQNNYDITTMPHYTSIAIQREEVLGYLEKLFDAGIQNIMALRGDKPKDNPDYKVPEGGFRYANELTAYIRETKLPFSIGGACYPEVHMEAPSAEEDLQNLKKKVDAGVDFLVTQLFFLNENYYRFVERCHKIGIKVPIVAGIMPITHFKQVEKFTKMTGCQLPKKLIEELESNSQNTEELFKRSFEYSVKQCQELLEAKAPGLHFYTLNQSSMTSEILKVL